jgi:hypothetical protein
LSDSFKGTRISYSSFPSEHLIRKITFDNLSTSSNKSNSYNKNYRLDELVPAIRKDVHYPDSITTG